MTCSRIPEKIFAFLEGGTSISVRTLRTPFTRSLQCSNISSSAGKFQSARYSGSNGFSLVRQILFKDHQVDLAATPAKLGGQTVGQAVLAPTKIYVKPVLPLLKDHLVEGVAHITGGGLIENLPRMFGDDLQAQVDSSAWPSLPVFDYLKELGGLSDDDCWQTFNMGLGMILAVQPDLVDQVKSRLNQAGEACYQVGQLVNRPAGEEKIVIK